jgi:hypothetical protein
MRAGPTVDALGRFGAAVQASFLSEEQTKELQGALHGHLTRVGP